MAISKELNIELYNKRTKSFLADFFYPENARNLPLVIFCHGYKGFKDWGAWHLVAEEFARCGYDFVKFNFAFNGTTVDDPLNFADPDAFGNNNYIRELDDLEYVIEYFIKRKQVDPHRIGLIGHSRGGGLVLVKAYESPQVKSAVTWNGIHNFQKLFPNDMEGWEKDGVFYVTNARTGEKLPHYYQFYTSYLQQKDRLNIQQAAQHLDKPVLIVQGDADEIIKPDVPGLLGSWIKGSSVISVHDGSHTFGASHPWQHTTMPLPLKKATEATIEFLKQNL